MKGVLHLGEGFMILPTVKSNTLRDTNSTSPTRIDVPREDGSTNGLLGSRIDQGTVNVKAGRKGGVGPVKATLNNERAWKRPLR